MLERLVRVETTLKHTSDMVSKIDARLRTVEKQLWAGIGGLAALQVALSFWS